MQRSSLTAKRRRQLKKGFNVLADLSELMEESPEKVFIADRLFIAKKRDNAKRFFRAVSESIHILRSQPELKGKVVPIIVKWLRIPAKLAEEAYDIHHKIFAFPRVSAAGAYKTFLKSSNANPGALKMT